MPPPYPSSCGKPTAPGKKPTSGLSAVASAPAKKIAHPASAPSLMALHAARPSSKMARPPSRPSSAARPPHQSSTSSKQSAALPGQQAAASCGKKPPEPESFMAPRDAKTVHPARRLAPGTAVCVRTRLMMITEKCCLVIWLPARVVSASDAYHCTVKYSANLSPALAGKTVRKSVDHVRVVAPQRATVNAESPRNVAPQSAATVKAEPRRNMAPQRAAVKAEPPRDMAPPAPERKDGFLRRA